MSDVVVIAALANNNVIGLEGKMPWYLKEDLQRFKQLTLGNPIIMGRKTYDGLPIKPLPKRTNIVVSRQNLSLSEGVIIKPSLEEAINYCKQNFANKNMYIIGGQQIYEQALELADILEITKIDADFLGDAFFPEINPLKWKILTEEKKKNDSFDYKFITYTKK